MILEIQQKLLHFLVDCCRALLHDVESSGLIEGRMLVLEPGPLIDNAKWSSIASIASEAPYRVPTQVNFKRLTAIKSASFSDAKDHIRALREDPGYFGETIKECADHRQETMLDTNGKKHPVVDTPLFWQRAIGNVISAAYSSLIFWDIINRQLFAVAQLQEEFKNYISAAEPLPASYIKSLLSFKYTLDQASKNPIALLKVGAASSPPLRSRFVREPQQSGSTIVRVATRGPTEHVFWLILRLWDAQQLHFVGLVRINGRAREVHSV
jgi:hypothetical protein